MKDEKGKPCLFMLIPNFGAGGAQKVFSLISNDLSKEYNIIQIVFNEDYPNLYSNHLQTISLDVGAGKNFLGKAYQFFKRCHRLYKLKQKFKPNICISHLEGANFVNVLSGGHGKRILTVHGSKLAFDENRKGINNFIERKILIPVLFRNSYKIVTVSNGIKQELIDQYKLKSSKIEVIKNGVDIPTIKKLAKNPIEKDLIGFFNKPVIIFSGRIAPQKNPLFLADLFPFLRNHFRLIILGDGPLMEELKMQLYTQGLNYHIYKDGKYPENHPEILILGHSSNPFKYINRASVFILPSLFEGYPLSILEAIICNTKIVASDCPTGVREILQGNSLTESSTYNNLEKVIHGYLLPPFNATNDKELLISLWITAIEQIIEEPTFQLNEKLEKFSVNLMISKWDQLIKPNT